MLKIYKNKVVIDGHEQTKEQCETMTLLANALKDSKDFKIVDYKNGYAEFEKVGNTNDLKFPPAPSDIIVKNGVYTTRANVTKVSIDLTTLSGWGNVADGQHSIQIVAKADNYRDSEKSTAVSFTKGSTTVTLSAGTYRFNETPTGVEEAIGAEIIGKMYSLTDDNTYGALVEFNQISVGGGSDYVAIENMDAENLRIDYDNVYWQFHNANEVYTATDTTKLRTITIETDQQVSQEFKTWFTANTTVVISHTLTFNSSIHDVTVNGNAVISPYTLQNNDLIVIKNVSGKYSGLITADTASYDTDVTTSPLALSNTNIVISRGEVDVSPSLYMGFKINYTTSSASVNTISFTIDGTTYQATEGMTWQEWVNSSYNTNNRFTTNGTTSIFDNTTGYVVVGSNNNNESSAGVIVANGVYRTSGSGGAIQ